VTDLRVRVLGGFEVDGIDAVALGSRKARTLLKMLTLARGAAVSSDTIAEGLWGDAPPAKPADQVSVLVSRLRASLGADRITRDDAGYRLHVDWIDVDALEELVSEAERRLAEGGPAAARAAAGAAVALARGPVLPEEDGEWLEADRAAAERLVARASQVAAEAALASGDPVSAAELSSAALDRDPLDEAALRILMRAHVASGRPASALAAYAAVRERLAEQLGVDPAPDTETLHTEILLAPEPTTPVPRQAQTVLPGRDDALAALDDGLRRGGLIVVEGEAGMGKTTLLDAWAANAAQTGTTVLRGRCEELARGLPLQVVMDALAGHLAFLEPDQAEAVLGPEAAVLSPLLGRLPQPDSRVGEAADQLIGQALVFGAVLTVLGRIATGRRVALLLDDVHLAGSLTVEWLHFLARRGPPAHMLVVAARRPEEGLPLPTASTVALGALDVEAAAAVVGADRAAALHARSGGHPLFLVELAAARADALPASIRESVAARCDRAGDAAVSLRAAAVLGPDIDLDVLAAVVRQSPVEVLTHLEEGERRGLLVEDATGFVFSHALVREALAAGTSAPRRALLHREAGRLLAARPDADALAVAHHARLGGDVELAARALTDAARVVSARYDQVEAMGLVDQAIALADNADARLVRGRARLLLTDYVGAREDGLVARDLGAGASGLELAAWASHYLREFDAAVAYAEEGAATAEDPLVRSGCLALAGWSRMTTGALRDAEPPLVAAVAASAARPHGMALVGLGGLRVFQGQDDEGIETLARLGESPEDPRTSLTAAYGYMLRGMGYGHQGRVVEALAEFEALEAAVERRNLDRFIGRPDNLTGWVLRHLGRGTEADERNERALEVSEGRGLLEPFCHALVDLAAGRILTGDLDGAAARLDTHDAHAAQNHSLRWRHITRARILRGRIALGRDDYEEAESIGAAVVEAADTLGSRRYIALAQLLVLEARVARGEVVDDGELGGLLEALPARAALEAWPLTASVARRTGSDRWWGLAERQLADLVARAGPSADALQAAARRVFTR
jgi:DNA-binding SARP family transcriptional activator/tetratricopeptide (TPR) repeat protein